MFKFNMSKKNLKKLVLLIMCLINVLYTFQFVYAHNAYYFMTTLDVGSLRYSSVVLQDDGDHRESTLGKFFEQAGSWKFTSNNFVDIKSNSVNGSSSQSAITNRIEEWKKLIPPMDTFLFLDFPDTKQLIYTFPSVHSDVNKVLFDGGNADRVQAEQIADMLVTSLNDCISYIIKTSEYNPNTKGELTPAEWLMYIGQELSIKGSMASQGNTADFQVNNTKFSLKPYTIEAIGTTPLKDLENNYNYLELSNDKNNNKIIVQFKMPKGYYSNSNSPSEKEYEYQPLLKNVPKDFLEPIRKTDVSHISWGHIVLQASYLYDVYSISATRLDEQYKPNMFEQYLVETSSGFIDSFQSKLGLYSFQELILNRGTRGSTYFYGMFPTSFYGSVMLLYIICFIIALVLLLNAIVKMIFNRSLASISVNKRISLMENIKDLILTILFLFLLLPILTSLFKISSEFIIVLNRATDNINYFGSVSNMSNGLLSGIVILFAEIIMKIYINFIYIYRGFMCGILFGTSPLFVCSIAFGGKYKVLFSTWLKEFIATISIQLIHALVLIFFSSLLASSATRTIENIVMMASFIPITKYFKQAIVGLPDGGGDNVAKGLTTSSLATGAGILIGASRGIASGIAGRLAGKEGITDTSSVSNSLSSEKSSALFTPKNLSSDISSTIESAKQMKESLGNFFEKPSSDKLKNTYGSMKGFKENLSNDSSTKSQIGDIAKTSGAAFIKTGLNAAKTAMYMGASIGSAAVGDNFNSMKFGTMAGNKLTETGQQLYGMKNILTNNGEGFKNAFSGNYDEKALNEADINKSTDSFDFTPETLRERGISDFTYNNDTGSTEVTQSMAGLESSQGISDIINPTKKTIGLEYSKNVYDNSKNLKKMFSAFNDDDKKDLKEKYKKDGIENVYKNSNGISVELNKEKFGFDYAKTNNKLGVVQYSAKNGISPHLPDFASDAKEFYPDMVKSYPKFKDRSKNIDKIPIKSPSSESFLEYELLEETFLDTPYKPSKLDIDETEENPFE